MDPPASVDVDPRDGFQNERSNASTGLMDVADLTGRQFGHPLNTRIEHALLAAPGTNG